MSKSDQEEIQTCPSCGAPRLQFAWDCAKCGAVFDASAGPATDNGKPETESDPSSSPPPETRAPSRSGPARRGTSARLRPVESSGGGLHGFRSWIDENVVVAVIVSFVIYAVVIWLFGALIIGATDSPSAVKSAYRDITGRPLPEGFGPTFAAHFVSHKLVVLDRPDQIVLVLYKGGEVTDDGELNDMALEMLDLMEIPWELQSPRSAGFGAEEVEIRVLELVGEGGPHVFLVPTSTVDGGRALEAVVGAPAAVLDVVDEMVSAR
jgi:rubredoxin